MAYDVF
jgi:hypothetical protein